MNERLIALKEKLNLWQAPTERKALPFSKFPGGFPCPGLVEISGSPGTGKTEFLLQFFSENPHLRVAWLELEWSLYPPLLWAHGISPQKIVFFEIRQGDYQWVLSQIITSQLFSVVVACDMLFQERDLRRIQLLSEKSQCLWVALNEEVTERRAWPFSLQIEFEQRKPLVRKRRQGVVA